jgi:hypothetical protein
MDRPPKPFSPDALRCRLPAEAWDDVCCGSCPDHDWWDDDAVAAAKPFCFGASDALDPLHLARCYALGYKGGIKGNEEFAWASRCVFSMVYDHPVAAVEIIRLAVGAAETDWQVTLIGCGELESLLAANGRRVIDEVERLARRDPAFREALSNVWQRGMPDDLWVRVRAASGRESGT